MPVCHSPSNDANASDTQRNRIRNRQLSARQWPARLSFLLLLLSEWIGVAWRVGSTRDWRVAMSVASIYFKCALELVSLSVCLSIRWIGAVRLGGASAAH